MKPLGRKYFKDNSGGKHHVKINGKYACWWDDVCTPNKSLSKREAEEEIYYGVEEYEVSLEESYLDSVGDKEYYPSWECSYKGTDLLQHEEGECIRCDWERQAEGKTWSSPDFIEAWDYDEVWLRKYKKG